MPRQTANVKSAVVMLHAGWAMCGHERPAANPADGDGGDSRNLAAANPAPADAGDHNELQERSPSQETATASPYGTSAVQTNGQGTEDEPLPLHCH